jgi:serine protease Do
MGIGLAIPVNMAKSIYEQLIAEGKVVRGYMGVMLQELTPELAENFGLEEAKGAIITKVVEDSPAEKAGIEFEDVVIELQGKPVEDAKDLMKDVAMLTPGTKVDLVVWRENKKKKLTIELGERPSRDELTLDDKPTIVDDLGLDVKDLSDELASRLGYEDLEGVVVVEVRRGSPAHQKGIEPGMLIMKVGRTEVNNTRDFYREIKKINKGETVVLLLTDGEQKRFVTLDIPEDDEQE